MSEPQPDAGTSDARNQFWVSEILVRQSAVSSDDPYDLIWEVVKFVNYCMEQGVILPEELPPNALRSYYTDYYFEQVNNGGHGQFAGNSNWTASINTNIREGLNAFGNEKARAIFDEFSDIMESDPDRAELILDGCGFGDILPEVDELDCRFYELDTRKTLDSAHNSWLRGLPELRIVEDEEYWYEVRELVEENPDLHVRKRKIHQLAIKLRTLNSLKTTTKMLCKKVGLSTEIVPRFGSPGSKAPDGREETAWTFCSSDGTFSVFVFEDFAFLCDAHLGDGRRITPVLHMTKEEVRELGCSFTEALSKMEYRELARVSMVTVERALTQADIEPLHSIAEVLLFKSGVDDSIEEISAVIDPETNGIEWELRLAERPSYYMTLKQNSARLDRPGERNLLTLDRKTLKGLIPVVETLLNQRCTAAQFRPSLPSSAMVDDLFFCALSSAQTGSFAVVLVACLTIPDEPSLFVIATVTVGGLLLAYRIHRTRHRLKTTRHISVLYPEAQWLVEQVTPVLLVKFAILGAFGTMIVLGLLLGSSLSLFGSRVLAMIVLMVASIIGFKAATKHWAKCRVIQHERAAH